MSEDLDILHFDILTRLELSEYSQEYLIKPMNWAEKPRENKFRATLYVLGKILNQLEAEKNRVEANIAWDQGWIDEESRDHAVSKYASLEALADENSESSREIAATLAESHEWHAIIRDLRKARLFRDDIIAEFFEQYPPEGATKRAKIQALQRGGFELWGDKKAIAGLTEASVGYVNSIRNNRGGDAEISKDDRAKVWRRDNGKCVRCGVEPDREQFHHIIPPRIGGNGDPENIAVLCYDCHLDAHNGDFPNLPRYDTKEEFWEWVEGDL